MVQSTTLQTVISYDQNLNWNYLLNFLKKLCLSFFSETLLSLNLSLFIFEWSFSFILWNTNFFLNFSTNFFAGGNSAKKLISVKTLNPKLHTIFSSQQNFICENSSHRQLQHRPIDTSDISNSIREWKNDFFLLRIQSKKLWKLDFFHWIWTSSSGDHCTYWFFRNCFAT